jgi:hypothetical protein
MFTLRMLNFLEEDLWPGTTSGLPVIHALQRLKGILTCQALLSRRICHLFKPIPEILVEWRVVRMLEMSALPINQSIFHFQKGKS